MGNGYIPDVFQQALRASIYTLQFIVAYLMMLLAMYVNGYILISMTLGVFVGFFLSHWGALESGNW